MNNQRRPGGRRGGGGRGGNFAPRGANNGGGRGGFHGNEGSGGDQRGRGRGEHRGGFRGRPGFDRGRGGNRGGYSGGGDWPGPGMEPALPVVAPPPSQPPAREGRSGAEQQPTRGATAQARQNVTGEPARQPPAPEGRNAAAELQRPQPPARSTQGAEVQPCEEIDDEIAAEMPEIPDEEDDEKLIKEIVDLKVTPKAIEYPPKPKPGTEGTPISLLTNYFILKWRFSDPFIFHRYDVSIEKQDNRAPGEEAGTSDTAVVPGPARRARKLNRRLTRVIIDQMIDSNKGLAGIFGGLNPVHDGAKTLFTKKKLVSKEKDDAGRHRFEVTVIDPPNSRPVNYIVDLSNHIELLIDPKQNVFPADVVQFVDIVLRFGPTKRKIPVGCKLFNPGSRDREYLDLNKELAFGFYQSARNCERGFMLNVDHATCVFHKPGPLLEVFNNCINDFQSKPFLTARQIREMNKDLRGMRIRANHLKYEKRAGIKRFSEKPATEMTFPMDVKNENGEVVSTKQMSVAKYFEQKYFKLRNPNYPIVDVGTKKKLQWYPLEVCELLPDQYVAQILAPGIQQKLTEIVSRQRPNHRFYDIRDSVNSICKDGDVYMSEFGIQLFPVYVKLSGRQLEAPRLTSGKDIPVEPDNDCSWRYHRTASSSQKYVYQPVHIMRWGVINLTRKTAINDDFLKNFTDKIIAVAANYGIRIAEPYFRKHHAYADSETLKHNVFDRAVAMVQQVTKGQQLQLIVFIVPGGAEEYGGVKYIGDKVLGIPTQCVSAEKFSLLLKDSYIGNVMLKINTRLNGVNMFLESGCLAKNKISLQNCMFVGVDVTHPAPNDKYKLSIASCVGTYDKTYTHYFAKLTVQEKARRELVDLHISMESLLLNYRKHNKQFPENIIIYRDGVSEGQFDQVFTWEISQLNDLFSKHGIKPKLTYIVVVKRHNTRFLTERRDDATRSLNVPAGLVVDSVITDPTKFDFFLCSHNALLGTLRPTHYFVLLNQNNYDANTIQKITFYMCFLNSRATKSGAVPAPIVMADSSAYRARKHIDEAIDVDSSVSSLSSDEVEENEEERKQVICKLNEIIATSPDMADKAYYI